MPPEDPAICSHLPQQAQTVFWRLLRPELLALFKVRQSRRLPMRIDILYVCCFAQLQYPDKPLSADAFTPWSSKIGNPDEVRD